MTRGSGWWLEGGGGFTSVTCFLASMAERPWDFLRQRFVGLFRSGRKRPIRFVQPTLYLSGGNVSLKLFRFFFLHHTTSKKQGVLPFCTDDRAESFGAFEGVGEVDPAAVFTRQLGLLFFLCQAGNRKRKYSDEWQIAYILIGKTLLIICSNQA